MVTLPVAISLGSGTDAFDLIVLLLRLAFIVLIYWFLYQIARVSLKELVVLGKNTSPTMAAPQLIPNMTSSLELIDPAESSYAPGTSFPLDPYTTLGRLDTNSIAIDDSFISGSHAEIVFDQGRWWLQDLGSTNGTVVNRQPVTGRVPLSNGDIVEFGRVQVRAHL